MRKQDETYAFISYSRKDEVFVRRLTDSLLGAGVKTWVDVENIPAGSNWQQVLEKALLQSSVLIYVASRHSRSSAWMEHELLAVLAEKTPVIPVVIDDVGASQLPVALSHLQWADFRGDYDRAFQTLLQGIQFIRQPQPLERAERKSKGYVFVSYAAEDSAFVKELCAFLKKNGYAYWDFRESPRDYSQDYSIELESVIKDAAGTLSVISSHWKKSRISMKEFHFSEEVGTPVFLLRVGDPGPTIALSGMTFIDFTQGHAAGFKKLGQELKRRGL
jgi:TIR domain